MTTPEDLKAAEEHARLWRIEAIKEFGFMTQQLPADVVKDIKGRLEKSFLAGISFARRWIPVSERLPEVFEYVPVIREGGWKSMAMYDAGIWKQICGDYLLTDVTHWLPITLPEEGR